MSTVIGAIVVFMLVVLLHEAGHFTVAKLCGIKVNEFSIGMGPKLYSKQKGETKYSLRALPIGGYVAMEGEEEASDDPRSFNNVSVGKRMAVVIAGAFMNFVLAIVAFFICALIIGVSTNNIGEIIPQTPAYHSELKVNDKVLKVNNVETDNWQKTTNLIASTPKGEDVNLMVQRNGKNINIKIKPEYKDGRAVIGIKTKTEKKFGHALKAGFLNTWYIVESVFQVLKMLFTGEASVKMLAGPVGVISMIGQETSKGFIYLVNILAIISANLGVVNLLPIPALDGGKFIFLLIEKITGKPISEKVEGYLSVAGFGLLIVLMLYVTVFGDLSRIFGR